jgi:hypothetical protein
MEALHIPSFLRSDEYRAQTMNIQSQQDAV